MQRNCKVQSSVSMVNVTVHDSMVRKDGRNVAFLKRLPGETLFLTPHPNKNKQTWKDLVCKVLSEWATRFLKRPLSICTAPCLVRTEHSISAQSRHAIPTVKHRGGGVMICFFFVCLFLQPQDLSTLWSLNSSVCRQWLQLQQDGWKRKESRCGNGPVKVHTSNWCTEINTRCCNIQNKVCHHGISVQCATLCPEIKWNTYWNTGKNTSKKYSLISQYWKSTIKYVCLCMFMYMYVCFMLLKRSNIITSFHQNCVETVTWHKPEVNIWLSLTKNVFIFS